MPPSTAASERRSPPFLPTGRSNAVPLRSQIESAGGTGSREVLERRRWGSDPASLILSVAAALLAAREIVLLSFFLFSRLTEGLPPLAGRAPRPADR